MNQALTLDTKTIGDFTCRIVDTEKSAIQPDKIVVLCHGFGAPGDDLVPCSRELYSAADDELESTRFIFPAAPIELDGGLGDSRAWWPIDMVALQEAMMSGNLRDLRNDEPEFLPVRRKSMIDLIETVTGETGISNKKVFLGGFSQGAMVATDVALHLEDAPGGLVIWSGTLLNENNWKPLIENRTDEMKFPVFQSHGRIDTILPFVGAEWLRDIFSAAQFKLEFLPFSGQHTIPMEGIEAAAKLIAEN